MLELLEIGNVKENDERIEVSFGLSLRLETYCELSEATLFEAGFSRNALEYFL